MVATEGRLAEEMEHPVSKGPIPRNEGISPATREIELQDLQITFVADAVGDRRDQRPASEEDAALEWAQAPRESW